MYTKALIAAAALAFTMIPSCPAPPVFIPLIAEGLATVAGNVVDEFAKREIGGHTARSTLITRQELPAGVPQFNVDLCRDAANTRDNIEVRRTGSTIRIENLPSECMVLNGVFVDEARPTPCGSACLEYRDLAGETADQLMGVARNVLNG